MVTVNSMYGIVFKANNYVLYSGHSIKMYIIENGFRYIAVCALSAVWSKNLFSS